jgi:hypothetical protein
MQLEFSAYPKYSTYIIQGFFRARTNEERRIGFGVKCHFEDKDFWKGLGYRWDAGEKVWFKLTPNTGEALAVVEEILANADKLVCSTRLNIITENPKLMAVFNKLHKKLEAPAKEEACHPAIVQKWEVPSHDERNFDNDQAVRFGAGDDAEVIPQLQANVRLENGKIQRVVLALKKEHLTDVLDGLGGGIRQYGGYYAIPWKNPCDRYDMPSWNDIEFEEDEEDENLVKEPEVKYVSLEINLVTGKDGSQWLRFRIPKNCPYFEKVKAFLKGLYGRKWNAEKLSWDIALPNEVAVSQLKDINRLPYDEYRWYTQVKLGAGVQEIIAVNV